MENNIAAQKEQQQQDGVNIQKQNEQVSSEIQLRTSQVDQEDLKRLLQDEAMKLPDLNIAMSGMAGRFPKADSVNEFEEHLRNGTDMINDQDESRFQCGLWGLPPRAGRLKDLSRFDNEFFGYTIEEAHYLDFQLRILYEVVYESILDAGVNPSSLRGTNTGVFFGLHCNEFENTLADDPQFKSTGYYAQFALRVAQYFDLRGLTVTFDAACASSFVGLHNAVQAIKDGYIDQAIVCSSNIPVHPTGSFIFFQMQMLSPTGYSRFLDSRADGYVKSEACVSVLLQRKHLARRNYCSFMSTMTSVDGYKPEGITFPSAKSQEVLIRSSKDQAKVSTNHIEYLEAHGTGTPAGDPQEARAISNVYYTDNNDESDEQDKRVIGPLKVGSVKTNMGHSEAASGLCALIKVALMLEHELIYKSLHFELANTNIQALMDGRLHFVDDLRPLKAKIVPLSCYGFGGSNVHVIVRSNEKRQIDASYHPNSYRLVVMFGRSKQALEDFFDQILNRTNYNTQNCLTNDFLYLVDSLSVDKIDRLMNYRGYSIVNQQTGVELARSIEKCQLEPFDERQIIDIGRRVHSQESKQLACHLLFAGIGSRPIDNRIVGQNLSEVKQFWSTIERLNKILMPFNDELNLVDMFERGFCNEYKLSELFVWIVAHQISLVNIVRDQLDVKQLGLTLGHSLGEIACAYATGLFDEKTAIMVALRLGQACDELGELISGRMVSIVGYTKAELEKVIQQYPSLRISCINNPTAFTLSGRSDEIDQFCNNLRKYGHSGVIIQLVHERVALHNELIMGQKKVRQKLIKYVQLALSNDNDYTRNRERWKSSFEGGHEMGQADAEYFVDMLSKCVNFRRMISEIDQEAIVLELGPGVMLESLIGQINRSNNSRTLHYTKMLDFKSNNAHMNLLGAIGRLYQAGASMDLSHFYQIDSRPVRRGTPSLGALIRWKHETKFFVPRYPAQFGKSSAKCEVPVDLVDDRDKYLAGHCIEGRVLYPATGYLFLIWRVFSFVKRKIYDACFHSVEKELVPVEFRNVRLLRAVILGQRGAQLYTHFEEGTGHFEIKEGGSVVADGYAFSPGEKPDGLLYEHIRQGLKSEHHECTLTKDDVYKHFRVNGYDYGESFQNITECSADGRYCRVKFNGHFIALTDSILQTIFLAVSDYAPISGGLFLPTRLDYVRFQPEVILRKMHACNMPFDLVDGSLDTRAKREQMNKMFERSVAEAKESQDKSKINDEQKQQQKTKDDEQQEKIDCFFDTYCDPTTGIIVTDGIEMRGIRATPAPRRMENISELLLESQQFIADYEEPVNDPELTGLNEHQQPYVHLCNTLALNMLMKLCNLKSLKPLNGFLSSSTDSSIQLLDNNQVAAYMKRHLTCLYDKYVVRQDQTIKEDLNKDKQQQADEYDIKKNGSKTLLSVLDQLLCLLDNGQINGASNKMISHDKQKLANTRIIRERIQENRAHLMHDLIQDSFTSERFMRPLVEQIIENVCMKKNKLRLIEINMDDALVNNSLEQLIGLIEPQLALDYSLAHPEPNRLHGSQVNQATTKTYTLKASNDCESLVQSLFQDNQQQLKELDLIVYKDVSCYSLPKQVVEENGLAPVVSSLGLALKPGGYCMLMMRQSLTLAERVLLALSEPELVGLSKHDMNQVAQGRQSSAVAKIERINVILQARCRMMLSEAERNKLLCVGRKSDQNGCLLLLFRRSTLDYEQPGEETTEKERKCQELKAANGRLLLRVQHDQLEWLEMLKENFAGQETNDENATTTVANNTNETSKPTKQTKPRTVWLCAVSTKDSPISGLVGMMQALRRELGSEHLRCFYDECSFSNKPEPISLDEIERSEMFQLALRRDQIWFCVRQNSTGTFRHLTINDNLSAERCLCSKQTEQSFIGVPLEQQHNQSSVPDAYVNNVTRGDLSSFAWHEAPFKYLDENERNQIVRVAYAALNFRDIMLATGRLPLDAISLGIARKDCLLGLEFSGLNAAGRRIMGMVYGRGLATRVMCPRESSLVLEIPKTMSLRDAATIPVTYSTAIMAIVHRGHAKRGESILIHAGSGGVGQAALHLSAYLQLEVYVTVGTKDKREFLLREFGHIVRSDRIFNSRDCSFELDILRATEGRGVDMVLNSLADDKLQASLNCLRDGGRFLEIGKYDMAVDSKLELLKLDHNKTFHGILLDKLFEIEEMNDAFKEQLRCVNETLQRGLSEGFIKPIKYKMFESNQIEQAFRYMATGKHIGKVLIEIDPSIDEQNEQRAIEPRLSIRCLPRFQLDPNKTYLVTGALGGFGLELCKWLAGCAGVRHLVLTSRTGPKGGYQLAVLRRLEANGCRVRIVTTQEADAASSRAGARELCDIARKFAPSNMLGGVFHLSMVLHDSLLKDMTTEQFELVCAPKLATCVHLDQETRNRQVDYFVVFSSVTSGKGNAGQANYAYANSGIERVCEMRRSAGLHALAVQWGAIGDVGVAFDRFGGNQAVIGGTLPQRIPSCMATLARMLGSSFTVCSSILPLNRRQGGANDKRSSGDLVGAIMHVLGIKDASKVSDDATLGDLGLDSLMAVEIRQYIEREYDMTLNIQEIRSLTIAKIREISETQQRSGKQAAITESASSDSDKTTGNVPVHQTATIESANITAKGIHEAAQIDKSFVASYVPRLDMPKEDFERLNNVQEREEIRPIFFLPPIHGGFKQLERVCSSLSRPCFGLNWTRDLGSKSNMTEVVDVLFNVLQRRFSTIDQNNSKPIKVDLVGYSFGATLAFELMLALYERNNDKIQPGSLVILDGSPKQIELGSHYLSSLTQKNPLRLETKVDELLMVYIISNTRTMSQANRPNYQYIQTQLRQTEKLEKKVEYASAQLAKVLMGNVEPDQMAEKRQSIAHAMEAFCRKYELICNYSVGAERKLPTGCTLIRAEKQYFKGTVNQNETEKSSQDSNQDLGLASLVNGHVETHILPGDHETFLDLNHSLVSDIITRVCA